jgi:hypothetical protein
MEGAEASGSAEESWSFEAISSEMASLLPLVCFGGVSEWEHEIEWGNGGGSDSDEDSTLRQRPLELAREPTKCDEHGVPWDTESEDDAVSKSAHAAELAVAVNAEKTKTALQRRHAARSRIAARRAAVPGIERGWDNGQPMEGASFVSRRPPRPRVSIGNMGIDPGRSRKPSEGGGDAAATEDDWERELRTLEEAGVDGGDAGEGEGGGIRGSKEGQEALEVKLDGLRIHDGLPPQAAAVEAGVRHLAGDWTSL